jgi:hypothetical protein
MITLKLVIYSLVLFILFVKIPSCKNSIIDLVNIILVIILFNIVLENLINTNMQENYEPIISNDYSFINKEEKNNSYDFEIIDEENSEKTKNDDESKVDDSKNNESEVNESNFDESNINELDNDESKVDKSKKDNIKVLEETTNNIVNVIKNNVKNIIDNTNFTKQDIKEENPKLDNKFIYGYSYLHTDNWSIPEKRQPVCKNVNPCKICSNKTTGYKYDLMKY